METTPRGYRLAAMGDVMLAREVGRHYAEAPQDFAMPGIRQALRDFDLVCLNLENPLAASGRPDPVQDPHVTFLAHPRTLDVVRALGTSMVSLGNNHMLDYGESALIETLERLDAAGIGRAGAGRNYEEANRPLLMERNGRKIAVLSYSFIYSANTKMASRSRAGVSDHRLHRILPLITELATGGHDVMVMSHWGYEYCFYPVPYQMRLARRMVDAGASLVLGHGPHYPQGIETYRGVDIVYSLGNFIFDEPHRFSNRAFIYGVDIDDTGRLRDRRILPVHLRHHVPHPVEGAERRRLERLVAMLGARYRDKDQPFWQAISAAYLTDICGRVIRSRSLKYLLVPTPSLYTDAGFGALVRKLKPANIASLSRAFSLR